jgi:uncharacterized membrane protein (DUF4010 family)
VTGSANSLFVGYAVAIGIGALIGAERERRKGSGPQRAAFGVRSFIVVALTGAVSAQMGSGVAFAIAGFAVTALAVAGYLRTADADPGLTTEIAWCLTFLLGALALSRPQLVAGLGALLALVLASRGWLHDLVRNRITERESTDAILIAAVALAALPLLPDRTIDPWGTLNPQLIGRLTVLVMLVNAAGYVLLRRFGARAGLPLAGFFGGFVSSTATIGSMGRRAREAPSAAHGAVAGATLSSVATVIQLGAVLAATAPALLGRLWPALIAMGAAAALYAAASVRHAAQAPAGDVETGRAFALGHALMIAVAMTAVVGIGGWLATAFGNRGAAIGIAAAGFADVHAAAASSAALARADRLPESLAVLALIGAVAANGLAKSVAAFVGGGPSYAARIAPGLWLGVAAFALSAWPR